MKETKLTREYTVKEEMLAVNFGSGSVRVLATPMVAAFFEGTAAELAQKNLEEPYTTVGSVITVEHLAPTALGCKVSVTAELTEIDGRIYRFKLEAYDNAGLIATGTHERVSVKKDRFEEKAENRKNQ
ncbi:thioesterase [Caproiciproducens galactitolivorans]|uniref:Fluoroacetyl-CoA thioesterase n=1 Tax=Caproiciproducens galactitolivorans TaxID=642589 RepID=A0A4Z0YBR1_9FIRM|nr:thioesterase family protein [Caproiciproducens galactitolivorans]QEY35103.1 thioesterase [Caproiciproducens galactitolivorans]TGJ76671.1 fluoroacetyl-CoA thioesterase [Caproiciproducens galactitolivorans]